MNALLEINKVTVQVGAKSLLYDVSFKVQKGKITAIVGGSGSGKSTIANSILRLLPQPLQMTYGQILFEHKNLMLFTSEQMRQVRGSQIGMIYQEPLWAFNPLMTIGQQMDEVLAVHTDFNSAQRYREILETLNKVQLPIPADIYSRYPHQLSGGQRQRAMIAQTLVTKPKLIIADEPTSNLDVILQAKIMDLFRHFKIEGMTILLISHDLGLVSRLADDIVILEQGKVIEAGEVGVVMNYPRAKYTKLLMEAI